jgi:hypothetical protein
VDAVLDALRRAGAELLGRASGPLHFRLLIMPTVVSVLGIRAGLRDARSEQAPFLWAFLRRPAQRGRLLRSALKDIGRIIVVALVLDTAYQVIVFGRFYVLQAVLVAFVTAVVPYVVLRGPIARLTRRLRGRRAAATLPPQGARSGDVPAGPEEPGAGPGPSRGEGVA